MVHTQRLSGGMKLPQAGIAVTKYLSTKEETLGKKENSKLFLLLLTSHLGLKQHFFIGVRKGVGTFIQSFQLTTSSQSEVHINSLTPCKK